jgi:hypothetical protein
MNEKRSDQILNAFLSFHADNPEVWFHFQRFAKEVIARGLKSYSANAIFERIRWHMTIDTVGEEVKLNNNFRAYYARMFHAKYPQHIGFFETRVRTSEERGAYEDDIQVFNFGPSGNEEELMEKLQKIA